MPRTGSDAAVGIRIDGSDATPEWLIGADGEKYFGDRRALTDVATMVIWELLGGCCANMDTVPALQCHDELLAIVTSPPLWYGFDDDVGASVILRAGLRLVGEVGTTSDIEQLKLSARHSSDTRGSTVRIWLDESIARIRGRASSLDK